jgi:hypothetical protein
VRAVGVAMTVYNLRAFACMRHFRFCAIPMADWGGTKIIRASERFLMSKPNRANLIITRAGRNSLHRDWISDPGQQNFDLLVAAYDKTIVRHDEEGLFYRYIPGPKIKGWMKIFGEDVALLDRYERIALIDDDIQTKTVDLSRCFDVGTEFTLQLWQPSLTWDSYATYGATLRNNNFRLRFVNFVEMMCPFFSSAFLRELLPTFELGFESAIDLIWCSISNEKTRAFAIVDEVSVKHTRPVGQQKSMNGFVDRKYESDVHACLKLFSTAWPACVASSGVNKRGNVVEPQINVSIRTLFQVLTVPSAPKGHRKDSFRCVSDHIRHQLTRKPMYAPDASSRLLEIIGPESDLDDQFLQSHNVRHPSQP